MTPRIIHVASGREWRGGQRQVWLLARELGRMGVDQVVVTGRGSELARRVADAGVRVRAAGWRAALDPRVLVALRDELRKGPAILHAHDAHALTLAGIARSVGRLARQGGRDGRPTNGHAATSGDAALVVTRRVTFPIRRPGFWTRAERVIAISSAVREATIAGGVSAERIEVIPSAVDLDGLPGRARPGDLHLALGLPSGTPLAVNIAALTPEKDHATLLEAAALAARDVPDLRWAIVGDGPGRREIERRIAAPDLAGRVHLLGAVPDADRLLAGATLFVLSSTDEGLGSSALAAWALGVPVVATRVGGLAGLLESGAGLLVPPRDPPALAAAVARVAMDAALRDTLARRGRAEVVRFDARGMAERVLAVYRSCAYGLNF